MMEVNGAAQKAAPLRAFQMTKEQRRLAMPYVTSCLDDVRQHFGDAIIRIKADENGHKVEWVKK